MNVTNVKIAKIVHAGNGPVRETRCGILWVPGASPEFGFPKGKLTKDDIDCMMCLSKDTAGR